MSEDAVAEETAETAQDAGTPVEDALDEVAGSGDETAEATVQEADLAVAEGEDAPTPVEGQADDEPADLDAGTGGEAAARSMSSSPRARRKS